MCLNPLIAALSFNDQANETNDAGKLSLIEIYNGCDVIYVGNGEGLSISHTCDAHVPTDYGQVKVKGVLVVHDLKKESAFS